MATIKYNPLLKRNLQEINDPFDPSTIESEIADLQQKKVTKIFSATDTLQVGEIAQYQGESSDVFINGYFYKKQVTPIVIPAGTFSLNFLSPFTTPLFTIPSGKYFFVENSSVEFGRFISKSFDNVYWHAVQPCNVGNPVVSNNGSVAYITYVSNNFPTSDTLNHDWNNPESKLTSGYYAVFSNYNGTNLLVALSQPQAESSSISSFAFPYNNLIFPIPNVYGIGAEHLTQDETIYYYSYTRVDTQPQPATATTTAAGLMSAADKSKLDGIDADANKYILPTATSSGLGGIKVGANLTIDNNGVLSGNYQNATPTIAGLMSAPDKNRLDQTCRYFYQAYSNTAINTVINSILRSNGIDNECGVASFGNNISDAPIGTNSFLVQWYRAGNLSLRVFLLCFAFTNEIYFGFFNSGETPTAITWSKII